MQSQILILCSPSRCCQLRRAVLSGLDPACLSASRLLILLLCLRDSLMIDVVDHLVEGLVDIGRIESTRLNELNPYMQTIIHITMDAILP